MDTFLKGSNSFLQRIYAPLPPDVLSTKQYWLLRAIREQVGGGAFQGLKSQAGLDPAIPLHRLTKWQASKVIAASGRQSHDQ